MTNEITDQVTYLSGKEGTLVLIPKEIARKQGIDIPTNTVFELTKQGIVIRKRDVASGQNTSDNRDTQSPHSEGEYHE